MKITRFTGQAAITIATLTLWAATQTSSAGQGPVRWCVPEDMPMPYYARIWADPTGTEIYRNDTWAVIVFYCCPEAIPPGFNLLSFYATEPVPATVSGFFLWGLEAMAAGEGPSQINLHGDGAVPVWFVDWKKLEAASSDFILTVAELEALGPLKGTASQFNEELHPLTHIAIDTQGSFEDGRRFQFHAALSGGPPLDCCYGPQIRIRIW